MWVGSGSRASRVQTLKVERTLSLFWLFLCHAVQTLELVFEITEHEQHVWAGRKYRAFACSGSKWHRTVGFSPGAHSMEGSSVVKP